MNRRLIRRLNERGPLRLAHPQTTKILKAYGADNRAIYYEVPELSEEALFSFCKQFDIFGVNKEATNRFVQLYIVQRFMKSLKSEAKVSGPVDFSLEGRVSGDYKISSMNGGMSVHLDKKRERNAGDGERVWQSECEVDCVYKIQDDSERYIASSYFSLLKEWKDVHRKSLVKTMKERGRSPNRKNLGVCSTVEVVSGDRFTTMENLLHTLFPGDENRIIIFPYNEDEFEAKLLKTSPLTWAFFRYPSIHMLLHTLSTPETMEIAKRINERYNQEAVAPLDPEKRAMQNQTIRQIISGPARLEGLGDIRGHLAPLLDEFEWQIDGYARKYSRTRRKIPVHHNSAKYVSIIKKIPWYYKAQPFCVDSGFEKKFFWVPVTRTAEAVDRKISDANERVIAKKMLLQLPTYHGDDILDTLNANEFPHSLPHLYLLRICSIATSGSWANLEELESRMKLLRGKMYTGRETDLYARSKRLPGSFETGKKR